MDIKSKAVEGIKWTSLSSFVVAILQIIQLIVLSSILNAYEFGLWAIISIIIVYSSTFSDLGVSAAVIHFQKTTRNQLSTLFWVNVFSGIIIFILIWIFAPFLLSIFNESKHVNLLLIASMSLPFSASGILFQNLLQKEFQFTFLSKIEIISIIIGVFVSIMLALFGYGVWSFVIGQLLNVSIKSLFLTIKGWKLYKITFYFNLAEVKEYLRFGYFQIGEKSVNLINQRLDQVIVGIVIGIEPLGFYNFAFNIISKPMAILNPIFNKVAYPLFSKLQNDKKLLQKAYLKVIKVVATINAFIYVLILIFAPIVIPLIFNNKWNKSIVLIQILSGVLFFRSIGNPVGSLALANGRADLGFKWNSVLLLLFIPTIIFFGNIGNSESIVIGLLILEILLFYPGFKYLIKPFIGGSFINYSITVLKPALIALFMVLSIVVSILFPGINIVVLLLVQLFCATSLYLFAIILIDKNLISETIEMVRRK